MGGASDLQCQETKWILNTLIAGHYLVLDPAGPEVSPENCSILEIVYFVFTCPTIGSLKTSPPAVVCIILPSVFKIEKRLQQQGSNVCRKQ